MQILTYKYLFLHLNDNSFKSKLNIYRMKNIYGFIVMILFTFFGSKLTAQASWAATTAPRVFDRYDDTYFINPDTGWAVTLYDSSNYSHTVYQYGSVSKTTDGGVSWQTMLDSTKDVFRDIAFIDAQTGFIGMLQPTIIGQDSFFMYQTHDGGTTWQPVTNIPGPKNAGICGLRAINDSTLYGVGRYYGPSGFYKTTNRGLTWTYQDMSAYACGLIDIYFFNADTGFVCGNKCGAHSLNNIPDFGSGTILLTTDAGNTWQVKEVTGRAREWCWKMSFPSRNIGYASIESVNTSPIDSQFCLKTMDGGQTWQDIFIAQVPTGECSSGGFDEQGIGFINDSVGWVGGRNSQYGLAPVYIYKTTDGGISWNPDYWGENINRFRFMSDTLAYFSGKTIYKYSTVHVPLSLNDLGKTPQIVVYPNPANTELIISGPPVSEIGIYTITGQMVADIKQPESNKVDISKFAIGLYLARIKVKENSWTIKWEKY